jgi:hypothetical protein
MIQHQRVTSEGEIRLGLQRLTNEIWNSSGAMSAARTDMAARFWRPADDVAGTEKQTNYDQNR